MNARAWLYGVALASAAMAAGCASHPPAPITPVATTPAAVVQPRSIPVTDRRVSNPPPAPTDGLAAALAQKTADFSKALNDSSTPPTDPSTVQWGQPAGTSTTPPRRPRLLTSNTPAANAPAVIEPPAAKPVPEVASHLIKPESDDGPTIVPESSDLPRQPHSNDDLATTLSRRLQTNPHDLSAQLDNQLYELLRDDTESKWTSTSELSPDDRELVASVIDGLSNLRNGIRQDANAPMSKRVQPLEEMAERAKAQAGLTVQNMTLCRKIDGFGKYEPIDPARFPAGRPNPMLVYCELSNFQSRLDDKHQWETQLQQQVTVFTDTGIMVWKDKPRAVNDECRNRRNDFFLTDLITLPPNLSIGRYLVKLTIIDKLANRVDESTAPVEIGA